MFKELVLLVMGFIDALKTLVWIFLLLGLLTYATALIVDFMLWSTCSEYAEGEFDDCADMFGGIVQTMYTLFQILTLESWSMAVVRPVSVSESGRSPGFFYVIFVFLWLTSFGLMNIVIGVIVENTLNAAKQNEDLIRKREEAKTSRHLEVMKEIFEAADEDQSGTMDRDEFLELMEKEETKVPARALGQN